MTAAALLNSEPGGAGACYPPMSREAAVKLDQRFRLMAGDTSGKLTRWGALVATAKARAIHVVLGFDSWTDYLAIALAPLCSGQGIETRRELVNYLYDAGTSQRP